MNTMDAVDTSEDLHQDQFLKDLNSFMKQRGTPIPPAPTFGGRPFDLNALYKYVTERGGLENVLKDKLWNSIVQLMELPQDCTNPAYTLRVLYLKYAYERQHFLYIDDDEGAIDYAPKTALSGPTAGIKPTTPMNRPVLRLDYRRTPLPVDSTRLRNILQIQRISFALRSGSSSTVQWGLELLALRSYQGEVMLRSGMPMSSGGNGGDEGSVLSVGNSLLSALANLARNYYTTTPSLLWKSEKIPDSPNETQILAILRNLTLVPQNDVEMASHTKCVEFLILSLSHPSPACVEDALETLAPLSYHLVLGWDGGESGEERGESRANSATLSVETSRIFVSKICSLLCEGMAATLLILANLTGQASNWPHLESVFAEVPDLVDRIDAMLNSGDESSGNALKVVFNLSRYGTKTKQEVVRAKGIMLYLVRFLGQPRSEEEMDDVHQLVMETLVNFCNDPSTKQSVLLYEGELLHLVLLETVASESVTNVLSTLAHS